MQNWIETKGSPFIIIDKKHANEWNGLLSDYEMASRVKEYAEIITMANYNAVILGSEPFPLNLRTRHDEIILFRWVYAPSHEIVDSLLDVINLDTLPVIESFSINWDSKEIVLFDSVDIYSEAENIITLSLASKHCLLRTLQFKKDDVYLIIHRLSPK
jgi:hypothetical protein